MRSIHLFLNVTSLARLSRLSREKIQNSGKCRKRTAFDFCGQRQWFWKNAVKIREGIGIGNGFLSGTHDRIRGKALLSHILLVFIRLSATLPFTSDDEDEITAAVTAVDYDMPAEKFSKATDEAKNLIKSLLVRVPE